MPERYVRRFSPDDLAHRESNWKSIERTIGQGVSEADLDWRPDTYWPEGAEGPAPAITDDEDLLQGYGAAPGFYAGSHIPDLEPGEVEIACVLMQSVLGDAVSVRARRLADGRIGYRIVDEHDEPYDCVPSSSDRPLSLRELGELLDRSEAEGGTEWGPGIAWTPLRCQFELGGSTDGLVEFLDVYSDVYPELGEWYGRRIAQWVWWLEPEEEFEGEEEEEEDFDEKEDLDGDQEA